MSQDREAEKQESNSEVIVGIDLGTTNSLVAVVDSGFPIILADEKGRRLLPSVVQYSEADPSSDQSPACIVGEEARNAHALHPERTVASAKRWMGKTDLSPDQASAPTSDKSHSSIASLAGRTPEQVSAAILRELKKTAEFALEQSVNRAVITVPAYFHNKQREATKRAAEMAGWQVERIINEPTAAALAYGLDRTEDAKRIAVFDLGGGTFDISILQLQDGLFEVLSTAGDTELGGDDIDLALTQFLQKKLNLLEELNSNQQATLLRTAREAKEILSREENYSLRLPFFHNQQSYECEISRDELEKIALPILERTRPICQIAFSEAEKKGVTQVDRLILVGGSTRIPLLQEQLRNWFGLEPDCSQNPDEAVALGAAIQAGILCGRVRGLVLVDVTPLSLGIETFGGLMNVIIPRNSTIPCKAGEMFTNAVANQESVAIRVLQGEREMARDNWLLGELEVPFSPGLKGSARVGVQFAIDQSGILEVLTRDTETNQDLILEIRDAAVDVDDEAVEKMVEESIDFAFSDMNERIWVEAEMKSRELLPAVDAALESLGNLVEDAQRTEILAARDAVEEILQAGEKDANALKMANDQLDSATQAIASLLVEKAFSEALSGDS